jgi:3-phosphoshikimate 1-carboxyvinyltransferase
VSDVLVVAGGRALTGTVTVPGDKSISHRALLFGALADGTSEIAGLSEGGDVRCTAEAVRALGATVDHGRIVGGPGLLHQPYAPIDAGNSGTTMRLLAGLVAGWDWKVVLTGDASLSRRPMDRVALPLEEMGARVEGIGERFLPPLTVQGGSLHGIDYTPPVASAQVKSCLVLAGLRASGETVVREPVPTRRHTEEMLLRCGIDFTEEDGADGHVVRVHAAEARPFELSVPGDPSQAAFWIVAACIVPGSEIRLPHLYVGPGRRGFLDVLRRMGADVEERATTEASDLAATADVVARSATLRATTVSSGEITGLDEVPVLAVAAARAEGTTVFSGVGELRVKESDRLAAVVALVRAFGGRAEAQGDDLVVEGVPALSAGRFDAGGDHRMAMAAAVAGAAVAGDRASTVSGFDVVATSYPGFARHLEQLAGERPGRAS